MTDLRKLTDTELRGWRRALAGEEEWEGVDEHMAYRMMLQTAGSVYDAGEADWDFDQTDAERMVKLN